MRLMKWFKKIRQKHLTLQVDSVLEEYYAGSGFADIVLCQKLLQLVPVDYFDRYRAYMGESKRVNTGIRNLDAFTHILQRAEATLKTSLQFHDDWYVEYDRYFNRDGNAVVTHRFTDRTIDQLMVTSDEKYGNPAEMVARMVLFGTGVCKLLMPAIEANSAYEKQSLAILNRMVIDLQNISVALIELAYQ